MRRITKDIVTESQRIFSSWDSSDITVNDEDKWREIASIQGVDYKRLMKRIK